MRLPQRGDEASDRSGPGGEPEVVPLWRGILTRAADFVAAKYRRMTGALALAIGAVLLIGAWQTLTTLRQQSAALRPLTARGTARLERAWWQLDFDPRPLGNDGTNWLDLTTAQLCARFRVETGDGGAVGAVACREWPKLRGLWQLTDESELAPGVPIPWAGPAGVPEIELRFSERAYAWLAARPPVRWHLTPEVWRASGSSPGGARTCLAWWVGSGNRPVVSWISSRARWCALVRQFSSATPPMRASLTMSS